MDLKALLPERFRDRHVSFTRMSVGMSGASVWRVQVGDESFILKVADPAQCAERWSANLQVLRLVSEAGVAPRIVHVDEERRAVLSVFIEDRSFFSLFANEDSRNGALATLGHTLRRVHDLPSPPEVRFHDPVEFLRDVWSQVSSWELPSFVPATVTRMLAETAPRSGRELVLSHNDVNPTNLIYDGRSLFLLDWDAAGLNDPLYDLAAVAVFLRFDDDACRKMIVAHDGASIDSLPETFVYFRRFIAALCGTAMLQVSQTPTSAPNEALSLGDLYAQLRSGEVDVRTPAGQRTFALALLRASSEL
ncbi:MAG: phosphotransferase [Acidobacteria bacterium]|nr:phosphotransferase [Acidobacteriota bacterium]